MAAGGWLADFFPKKTEPEQLRAVKSEQTGQAHVVMREGIIVVSGGGGSRSPSPDRDVRQ